MAAAKKKKAATGKKAAPAKKTAAKSVGAELLAAIAADPTNRDALAVYSDFLLEQDDPFGSILASVLAGQLSQELADEYVQTQFAAEIEVKPVWDPATGFLRSLEMQTFDGKAFLRTLAKMPAAQLLHRLRLTVWRSKKHDAKLFSMLADAPLPQTLRELALLKYGSDERGDAPHRGEPVPFYDLRMLGPHIQQVEDLEVSGASRLGALSLPRLKRLSIVDYGETDVQDIAASKLPELRHLELRAERVRHLAELDVAVPLLDRLTLSGTASTFEAPFRDLGACPLRERIRVLDLKECVSPSNSYQLVAVASAFTRCEELRVYECSEALETAFGPRLRFVTSDTP